MKMENNKKITALLSFNSVKDQLPIRGKRVFIYNHDANHIDITTLDITDDGYGWYTGREFDGFIYHTHVSYWCFIPEIYL